MSLFRTKSVEQSIAETEEPEHRLKKNLGALDLTSSASASSSAPASSSTPAWWPRRTPARRSRCRSLIAGLACALAALCYAEFASTVPVAGSAYTFCYATFGELIAWIIGWDLVLEFTVGASALAAGFSGYLQNVARRHGARDPGVAGLGQRRRRQPAGHR